MWAWGLGTADRLSTRTAERKVKFTLAGVREQWNGQVGGWQDGALDQTKVVRGGIGAELLDEYFGVPCMIYLTTHNGR